MASQRKRENLRRKRRERTNKYRGIPTRLDQLPPFQPPEARYRDRIRLLRLVALGVFVCAGALLLIAA